MKNVSAKCLVFSLKQIQESYLWIVFIWCHEIVTKYVLFFYLWTMYGLLLFIFKISRLHTNLNMNLWEKKNYQKLYEAYDDIIFVVRKCVNTLHLLLEYKFQIVLQFFFLFYFILKVKLWILNLHWKWIVRNRLKQDLA